MKLQPRASIALVTTVLAVIALTARASVASAQIVDADDGAVSTVPAPTAVPEATGAPTAEATVSPPPTVQATPAAPSKWSVRTRHDAVISWAPRYRLDTSTNELGLEQQLWLAVDPLPLYYRVSLDATFAATENTSFAMHFSGWGTVDLVQDSDGGLGAGDVAMGYVELAHAPLSAWAGRRFLTYGPPGGLHVDGLGAAVRSGIGLFAELFVGRPVTPIRSGLLGPQAGFDGTTVAYGARVGYQDAGLFSAAASYAELWGHGTVGTRAVDITSTWDPGILHLEGNVKIDALNIGVMQARVAAMLAVTQKFGVDLNYLHVEPARWIAAWSILSAFETTNFDEVMAGVTYRLSRTVAVRGEGAARVYSLRSTGDATLGYRADVSARLMPGGDGGPSFRVQASRRGDGVLSYTVLSSGAAVDVWRGLIVSVDGALAADDDGKRLSAVARSAVDFDVMKNLRIGVTGSFGRAALTDSDVQRPFSATEFRGMLRARWVAEVGP